MLTDEERKKFSAWLKQDAESDKLITQQMEKMKGMEVLAMIKKQEMGAKLLVARILDSISTETIG